VGNVLIIGDDIKKLHELEDEFTQVFKMTSLGITSLYIGLNYTLLSTRATTLVLTSSRSDSAVGSYELPKSRDSNRDSFRTISGLQLGSPGKKSHLDVVPVEWRR
jgi:hypothetical protein